MAAVAGRQSKKHMSTLRFPVLEKTKSRKEHSSAAHTHRRSSPLLLVTRCWFHSHQSGREQELDPLTESWPILTEIDKHKSQFRLEPELPAGSPIHHNWGTRRPEWGTTECCSRSDFSKFRFFGVLLREVLCM